MNYGARVSAFVFTTVVATAVVSGPLIGAVDLTHHRSGPKTNTTGLGTGNVTVESVSLPSTATLRKGKFGSGSYYLEIPVGRLELANKTGRPVISYEIEVQMGNISYNQESAYFVGPETGREINLSLDSDAFQPEEIHEDTYTGQLVVTQRANGTNRVLAKQNLTVEVVG